MHILIMPSWYPTREDPLSGSFFAEQADALADFGHRVSVIVLRGDAARGRSIEETRRGKVVEYTLHYRPRRFHLSFFPVVLAMTELFSTAFREDRPEIIHVHSFRVARYARWLKRLYRIPYVITEHVSWFERGLLSDRDRRSAADDYNDAAAVIAVSSGLKEQIQPLCRKEVRVVPNLVSDRFFHAPLERPSGEAFRFLSVGSLNRNKGMDAVIDAFADALKECPSLRLTICGDGQERSALEAQAETLGLSDRVEFTGRVSRERCVHEYGRCGAFVLASRVETFGLVLAEAMACGRPIVMTKTGAWRELAAEETGLAAEIDDTPALSCAMVEMVRNAERYDPEAIRSYCRRRFSGEAVCERLTGIYQEVLRNRTCR